MRHKAQNEAQGFPRALENEAQRSALQSAKRRALKSKGILSTKRARA
jgi:hypothetical protein